MAFDVVHAMALMLPIVESPDVPLVQGMVGMDTVFERVALPTIDANEMLLARLITDFEKPPPKSTLLKVLARYRVLRSFPASPHWCRDEAEKLKMCWRYVLSNESRASSSPHESMRRLKNIVQSRKSSVVTSVAPDDPYVPGELDSSHDEADVTENAVIAGSDDMQSVDPDDDSIPNGQPHTDDDSILNGQPHPDDDDEQTFWRELGGWLGTNPRAT